MRSTCQCRHGTSTSVKQHWFDICTISLHVSLVYSVVLQGRLSSPVLLHEFIGSNFLKIAPQTTGCIRICSNTGDECFPCEYNTVY